MLATLAACGASGVAGGSLLLIPMACSLFGIPNDIAMAGSWCRFIIGVIQDSVETALIPHLTCCYLHLQSLDSGEKKEKKSVFKWHCEALGSDIFISSIIG